MSRVIGVIVSSLVFSNRRARKWLNTVKNIEDAKEAANIKYFIHGAIHMLQSS